MDSLLRAFGGRPDAFARRTPGGRWRIALGLPDEKALELHDLGLEELGALPAPSPGGARVLPLEADDPDRSARAARGRGLPFSRQGRLLWLRFDAPLSPARARALARILRARPLPADEPVPLPRALGAPAALSSEALEEVLAERDDPYWAPLPLARREAPAEFPEERSPRTRVILGSHLEVPDPDCPEEVERFLRRACTLVDPHRKARRIRCGGRAGARFVAPRGVWPRLKEFLEARELPFTLEDRRLEGTPRPLRAPRLDRIEEAALEEVLRRDACLVRADSAEAARPLALAACARRGVTTLVVTRRVEAWLADLERVLGIPRDQAGVIDGSRARLGWPVTVASWRALAGRDLEDLGRYLGQVVVDEVHRIPARTLVDILRQLPARYLLGLQGAPRRRDGLERLGYAWLGEVVRAGRPRPRTRLVVRLHRQAVNQDLEDWLEAGGTAWVLGERKHRRRYPGALVGRAATLAKQPRPEGPVALFVVTPPKKPGPLEDLVNRADRVYDYPDLETEASDKAARRRMAFYGRVLGADDVPDLPSRPRPRRSRSRSRESSEQLELPLW